MACKVYAWSPLTIWLRLGWGLDKIQVSGSQYDKSSPTSIISYAHMSICMCYIPPGINPKQAWPQLQLLHDYPLRPNWLLIHFSSIYVPDYLDLHKINPAVTTLACFCESKEGKKQKQELANNFVSSTCPFHFIWWTNKYTLSEHLKLMWYDWRIVLQLLLKKHFHFLWQKGYLTQHNQINRLLRRSNYICIQMQTILTFDLLNLLEGRPKDTDQNLAENKVIIYLYIR